MKDFDAAGIAVYALSYDEADALRDFRDAHSINYTLLSDPNSEVIRSFGILNTLIDSDDHPWFGIPYPGTYVVSADGLITHKFFDNNLAVRSGPEQYLRAVQGDPQTEPAQQASEPFSAEPEPGGARVRVTLDGHGLARVVQRDLVVRFDVPSGSHVYAEPPPLGSIAAGVTLDPDERLVQRPVIRPAGETHALEGTEESFLVHHDSFELRLPITLNSTAGRDVSDIKVSGVVRWQCCDDKVCGIPESQRFELTLPVSESPPVALGSKRGAALEPNAMAHFQKMSTRRTSD